MKRFIITITLLFILVGSAYAKAPIELPKGEWQIVKEDTVDTIYELDNLQLLWHHTKGFYEVDILENGNVWHYYSYEYAPAKGVLNNILKGNGDFEQEFNITATGIKTLDKPKLKKRTIANASAEDTATSKRECVATVSSRVSEAKEDFTWRE